MKRVFLPSWAFRAIESSRKTQETVCYKIVKVESKKQNNVI